MKRTDNLGRPIEEGRQYLVGQRSHKTRTRMTIESSEYDDLIAVDKDGLRYRVDDLAQSCVFEVEGIESESFDDMDYKRTKLLELQHQSRAIRAELRANEQLACDLLGVGYADGSDLSDRVMHFMRDDIGTVDRLLDMAGAMHEAAT